MCCYYKGCTLSAHMTCLAPRLSDGSGAESLPHLLPVSGACPQCGQELLWGELVRRHKASDPGQATVPRKTERECVESVPARKKRKVSLKNKDVNK